jgi:putative toxin-antitoxin system antitoxin component (TIGR02293 family)
MNEAAASRYPQEWTPKDVLRLIGMVYGKDLTRMDEWAICTAMRGTSPNRGVSEAVLYPTRQGFALDVVDRALEAGKISPVELDRLVLPRKTLAHRRILGSLTPDQSDRLARVLRMINEAETTFGDPVKAHTWLRRPTALLDGEAPLDRLDTDFGIRQVEALLGRIAFGLAV